MTEKSEDLWAVQNSRGKVQLEFVTYTQNKTLAEEKDG